MSSSSFALSCKQALTTNTPVFKNELYVKLIDSFSPNQKSSDLSQNQKEKLRNLINDLSAFSSQFDQTRTQLLRAFPQSFLPRLRTELRRIGEEFRNLNQSISDELERFLYEESLTFKDLEFDRSLFNLQLHPDIHLATEFIKNPSSIQFGLGYFMDSVSHIVTSNGVLRNSEFISKPGYTWGKEPEELSRVNAFKVNIVVSHDDKTHYPGSDIPIPRDFAPDGLTFSGLPLTPQVLNFFKINGDLNGQLSVNFQRPHYRNTFLEQMFFRNRNTNLSRVKNRWSPQERRPIPLLTPSGYPVLSLNDPKSYILQTGVILAPSEMARQGDKGEVKDFNSNIGAFIWGSRIYRTQVKELTIITQDPLNAEFIVLPTHQEFLTALIALIYNN